jgi:hypothetical protein
VGYFIKASLIQTIGNFSKLSPQMHCIKRKYRWKFLDLIPFGSFVLDHYSWLILGHYRKRSKHGMYFFICAFLCTVHCLVKYDIFLMYKIDDRNHHLVRLSREVLSICLILWYLLLDKCTKNCHENLYYNNLRASARQFQ